MCQKPIIMMKNVVDVRISRVKGKKKNPNGKKKR
jgi:hypothetical protein